MNELERITGNRVVIHHSGKKYLEANLPFRLSINDLESIAEIDGLILFHVYTFDRQHTYYFTKT